MPEISWIDGLARAYGKKAVNAYVHTSGVYLEEFFKALKSGKWLAAECGKELLLPPRNPCPDGQRPTRLKYIDGDFDWLVETLVDIDDDTTSTTIILARPLVEGVIGGVFHRLCNNHGKTVSIGARIKPVFKQPENRIGSLSDILCYEPEFL